MVQINGVVREGAIGGSNIGISEEIFSNIRILEEKIANIGISELLDNY